LRSLGGRCAKIAEKPRSVVVLELGLFRLGPSKIMKNIKSQISFTIRLDDG
jgi:hypothetical protein